MASNRILYSYMYDPNDPKRVVTIGRKLVDEGGKTVIKFAISVNNPGVRRFDHITGEAYHIGLRDNFTKKKARIVVDGRLEKDGCHWVVNYTKDQHPMDTIRTYIALNHSEFQKAVVRTSEFYTEMRDADEKFNAFMARAEKFMNVDTVKDMLFGSEGDKVVNAV